MTQPVEEFNWLLGSRSRLHPNLTDATSIRHLQVSNCCSRRRTAARRRAAIHRSARRTSDFPPDEWIKELLMVDKPICQTQRTSTPRIARSAFTLVELLVVIAII